MTRGEDLLTYINPCRQEPDNDQQGEDLLTYINPCRQEPDNDQGKRFAYICKSLLTRAR
jgi:hypothetical protein